MTLPALLKDRLALPLIGSPMFIISQPELVIAQCRAGVSKKFKCLLGHPVAHPAFKQRDVAVAHASRRRHLRTSVNPVHCIDKT